VTVSTELAVGLALGLIGLVTYVVRLRRRQAAALEREHRAYEVLAQTNRELEVFAAAASHDLRAPLISIEGFAASIERRHAGGLDERGLDYLRRIRSNAESLHRMIEELLLFARAGVEGPRAGIVDTNALAAEVIEAIGERVGERCRIELAAELPSIRAHPARFKQVLRNLIENALAHGAREGDPVRIVIAGGLRDGFVEVVVQDDGAGVPLGERSQLFTEYVRGEGGATGGSGMGLALVQRVMEANGGRVRYESSPGGGARFVLAFPEG
jgi:signal transduction histidine kinase